MSFNSLGFLAVSVIVGAGCGNELDVSFGSLQGSYTYQSGGFTCSGRVSGSRGSGECVRPPEEDTWGDYHYRSERVWDFDLVLADSRVGATITETRTTTELDYGDSACTRTVCVDTYDVSMSKISGRSDEGEMAALAGVWEGSVSAEHVCRDIDAGVATVDQSACNSALAGKVGRESSRRLKTWTGGADLFGKVGSVNYAWQGTDSWYYDELGGVDEHYHDDPYEWGDGPTVHHVSVTATQGSVVVDSTAIQKR